MKLKQSILVENECYKCGAKLIPKGVMVHSTGCNNPNLKRYVPDDGNLGKNIYNNHWNTFRPGGRRVCVHAFIGKTKSGDIATYQTLPWDMVGWHCGGQGNHSHIGFEICEDNLKDKSYFMKVYAEAVELTAYLCKKYKLNPLQDGVVICHSEGKQRGIASNHGDVMHWFPKFGKTMDDFRSDVAKALNIVQVNAPPKVEQKNEFKPYLVKINTAVLNVRAGAGVSHKINLTVKKGEVYTIVDEENGWGKLKSGAGWIKLSYTKKV